MTNYYPVEEELASYTNDLSRLFKDFDCTGSLRFEDFCSSWRKLNFSFIHCGKKSAGDRNQGTERLLRCVSGYFNPETPYLYRIAAIYSTYAIYYTQICKPNVKIRMTVTMWNDLKQLQSLVRQLKHNDVDYVITKLENDKAFIFTLMPKQLEYGNKELMTNMESSGSEVNTLRKYYVPGQYIQEATNNLDFLESITSLEDEYLAVKFDIQHGFINEFDERTVACLHSITDCRSRLIAEIERFREWMKANAHNQATFDDSQRPVAKKLMEKMRIELKVSEKGSKDKERTKQSRAERLQALKLQSFRQPIQGINQVETEAVAIEEAVERKGIVSKRSAIVEKRDVRSQVKRWKNKHVVDD